MRPGCPPWGLRRGIDTVVYFAPLSDSLSTMSKHSLRMVTRSLIESPEIEHVWIVGHADSYRDREFQQEISMGRAELVRKFLLAGGVDSARMTATGLANAENIAGPGDDAVLNRRVEFRIGPRSGLSGGSE